jgi:tetratricopeptide (TPR) repeat protein
MQARARNRARNTGLTTDERIDQIITWIAVGTLFMIPLLFSYFKIVAVFDELRITLLHLSAGLIASLWLWQTALRLYRNGSQTRDATSWDLVRWAGKNAARWALVAVGIFTLVQLFSTLLSPLPIISFFGSDDARSGYNTYDSFSMTLLLFAIAVRFRTARQLELLAYALAGAGTVAAVYGIAQHFGWDPIGENAGNARTLASFGNTLNFGGFLVMSIPATMAVWLFRNKRPKLWMVVVALALAFQFTGVLLTGSRGATLGSATGIGVFAVIALLMFSRRDLLRIAAATIVALVISLIITALPSPQGVVAVNRALSISDGQPSSDSVSTDIGGGLSGRFSIWKSTMKLATTWDMPLEEPTVNAMLRPLFGVGPDLFVYSFPFVGAPQTNLAKVDHAHNFPLHTLIELGFLGLAALTAITTLVVIAGIRTVVRLRSVRGINTPVLLSLAFLPALAGKLVEVQTSVPRVSDLAMMIALIGAAIAVHEYVRRSTASEEVAEEEQETRNASSTAFTAPRPAFVGSILIAAILVTGVFLTLFFSWDVRRLSASRHLAVTHDDPDILVRSYGWQDAQAQAPERDSFTVTLFEQYMRAADQQKALGNEDEAIRMLLAGRDLLLVYEKRDPFMIDAQLGLGKTVSKMTEWGYHEYAQEMSVRYIKIVRIYPYFPSLAGTAATVMASLGNHDLAIEFAEQAIATEATTKPWAKAWYAKGRSLFELGREDEAIEALMTATQKEPNSDGATLAHQILAEIYELRGDTQNAEKHDALGRRPLGLG